MQPLAYVAYGDLWLTNNSKWYPDSSCIFQKVWLDTASKEGTYKDLWQHLNSFLRHHQDSTYRDVWSYCVQGMPSWTRGENIPVGLWNNKAFYYSHHISRIHNQWRSRDKDTGALFLLETPSTRPRSRVYNHKTFKHLSQVKAIIFTNQNSEIRGFLQCSIIVSWHGVCFHLTNRIICSFCC